MLFRVLLMPLLLGLAASPSQPAKPAKATKATKTKTAETKSVDLACRLEALPKYRAGDSVEVQFTLSNPGKTAVRVLRWYTPLEGLKGDIFRVSRAGNPLPYTGPLVKRGDPQAGDYVEVPAGESVSGVANISTAYGILEPGSYRVSFQRGLDDVIRTGDASPRPRSAQRAEKLSCGEVKFEVAPK